MERPEQIFSYLADEANKEVYDYRLNDVDELTKAFYIRAKEFYWTVTRLIGLGHLHDGSRPQSARQIERPAIEVDAIDAPIRPRVLIDMTATHRFGQKTGIQRVVLEIAKNAVRTGAGVPVVIENGRLVPYYRNPMLPDVVEIAEHDKFLMLDASWQMIDELAPVMQAISAHGGENVVGLHDIIPLLYPAAFSSENVSSFQTWFETIALESDAIICVSKSTAESLIRYMSDRVGPCPPVGWWRLGADFELDASLRPSKRAVGVATGRTPFFLGVGTLEPRKGYSVALSAFERLWDAGVDARYVIVGRRGWHSRALERRICQHPEFGRRLIWLDDAGDADLRHLYEHADGLIAASFAEGFGLPLVEAAHHGLRVIASDIPVFREIAGDGACFFDLLDAESLALCIRDTLARRHAPRSPGAWTWRQSTEQLLGLIRTNAYQARLASAASRATEGTRTSSLWGEWRQGERGNGARPTLLAEACGSMRRKL